MLIHVNAMKIHLKNKFIELNVFKFASSIQVIMLCNAGVSTKVREYYKSFVNTSNIMTVFNITTGHTFVSSLNTYIKLFLHRILYKISRETGA